METHRGVQTRLLLGEIAHPGPVRRRFHPSPSSGDCRHTVLWPRAVVVPDRVWPNHSWPGNIIRNWPSGGPFARL